MTTSMMKVHINLEASSAGIGGESLWADDLGDGRAKVDNVPFFVDLFSLGSVVVVDEDSEVVGVESHAYAANGIVGFSEGADEDEYQSLMKALEGQGIAVERARPLAFVCAIPEGALTFFEETVTSVPEVVEAYSFEELPKAPFSI